MWELDRQFHTPGWAERRLKELNKQEADRLATEELQRYAGVTERVFPVETRPNPATMTDEEKRAAGWHKIVPVTPVLATLDQVDLNRIRTIVREEVTSHRLIQYRGYSMQELDKIIDFARQHGYGRK